MIEQSNGLHFMYDHTGVMGFTYQGQTYFYQKDAQENIVSIVNSQGALVASYVYDAWGNHRVLDSNGEENTSMNFIGNINPLRYSCYYFDTETRLYYVRTRYYDSEVSRFICADDVAYICAFEFNLANIYAYARNNPVMYYDDCGTFPKKKSKFVPRKPKRHGSENRQPSGQRERNVGHPNGEEHSRRAKGNKGVRRIVAGEIPEGIQYVLEINSRSYIGKRFVANSSDHAPVYEDVRPNSLNSTQGVNEVAIVVIVAVVVVACVVAAFFTGGQSLWGLAVCF